MTSLCSVDIRLIRTFVAVVESCGLSAAQVRLGRSLAAISSDLTSLELRLGGVLCKRGRSGFALTDFGRQVLEASRTLVEALDHFEDQVQPERSRLHGTLRIAVNDGHATDFDFVLAQALARFKRRPRNQVRIELAVTTFKQPLEALLNDQVDIGFGFFGAHHPRIERYRLHEERNQLYCGRGHALFDAAPADVGPDDVIRYPMVMRDRFATPHHPAIILGVEAAAIGTTPGSRIYMIRSGCYLGYLAEHHARPWVEAGEMRVVLPEIFGFSIAMEMAVKASAVRSGPLALFIQDFEAAMLERGTKMVRKTGEDFPATADGLLAMAHSSGKPK